MSHASVLIISDEPEFARTVVARWHSERHVPDTTIATSEVWHAGSARGYALVILGPVRPGSAPAILSVLASSPEIVTICVADDEKSAALIHSKHPNLTVIPRQDGWVGTLILVCGEALRRVEAVCRAQRAERVAIESQGYAMLGRYMLEMRPSVNNALTSVLGNADLLLLDPEPASSESHEQIRAIHAMALRLHEVIQRFSSLASEVRAAETISQVETQAVSHGLVGKV